MQIKTYQNERDMVADYAKYSRRGDCDRATSANESMAEIRAGTTQAEMALRPSVLPERRRDTDCRGTAERAQSYTAGDIRRWCFPRCRCSGNHESEEDPDLPSEAFAEAQAMAPSAAATYNHGVKLAEADSGELKLCRSRIH